MNLEISMGRPVSFLNYPVQLLLGQVTGEFHCRDLLNEMYFHVFGTNLNSSPKFVTKVFDCYCHNLVK